MNIAEFFYTTLFRSPRIRAFINKIIIAILPQSIRIGDATIMINPKDPVISGALTFGVYEKSEIALMQRICKLGQIVLDIGANVGLYTAIAGSKVGPSGMVIALEPEPETFNYLQKTVSVNKLANTRIIQAAASSNNGDAQLYTSSANRGDHRMYRNNHADGNVKIKTVRMDDYLHTLRINHADIIKIDVQGYEGHVIAGLEETIKRSPRLIMLMEFWPSGLSSAGTDPIELLKKLENLGLTLFEIKNHHHFIPVTDKKKLIARLPDRRYANLLLLGPQAEWTP